MDRRCRYLIVQYYILHCFIPQFMLFRYIFKAIIYKLLTNFLCDLKQSSYKHTVVNIMLNFSFLAAKEGGFLFLNYISFFF